MKKSADEIRSDITAQILTAIKKGCPPWRQPWSDSPNAGAPRNFTNKRRYTGINPLLLMLSSEVNGWLSQQWGTSSSWTKHTGAHVKKGEKATHVTLFRQIPKKDKATGKVETTKEGKDKTIPLMRLYPVFNVEQMQAPTVETLLGIPHPFGIVRNILGDFTKGRRTTVTTKDELLSVASKVLPAKSIPDAALPREQIAKAINEGITAKLKSLTATEVVVNNDPDFVPAEELMGNLPIPIKVGGAKAMYVQRPKEKITLPSKASFATIADFYQTAAHEMIHAVVNGGRVEVKDKSKLTYAFSELVAEMGACFVLMALDVPRSEKMLPQAQSYIDHWLEAMGGDPKYIFEASSLASKAADWLLALVGKANPVYDEGESDGDESHEKSVA
jgi:antirestriction protein ArdC